MHKDHRRRAPLLAVFGLLALLVFAPAVQASHVAPRLVLNNPDCASLGLTTIDKFEPVKTETKSGIALVRSGETVSFTSSVAVDAVIVKGGPDANVYEYAFDTFGDSGLMAPDNGGQPFGLSHVEFCTDGQDNPRSPAIDVEKVAVASPIPAGDVAQFTFVVTNTGNVELSDYVFSDARCDGGNATQTGGDTDSTFGVGEVRNYSCSVDTAETDTADVVNTVCVSGKDAGGGGTMVEDCDTATVTLTPKTPTTPVTPTTPGGTTPGGTTPGGTTPGGGVLPDTIASGQASLRGPSGCVKQAFRARVTGRSLASVTFFVDGKRVKRFTDSRSLYTIKVNPLKYGLGRHRVTARVTFVSGSGTQARTLRLTFRRCASGTVAPRFTG